MGPDVLFKMSLATMNLKVMCPGWEKAAIPLSVMAATYLLHSATEERVVEKTKGLTHALHRHRGKTRL